MEPIKTFFKNNALQLTVQIVGVIAVVLNLWLVGKLAPLAKDLELLSLRVSAIESRNATVDPLVNEFYTFKQEVVGIRSDVTELKADVKYLIQIHLERFGGSPQ